MKLIYCYSLLPILLSVFSARGETGAFVPSPVESRDFGALQEQSPFSRALNLSDSLILTGLAMVDQEQVATLLNKETKETFVVSSRVNAQGWKMVELKPDEDLEKVSAKVAVEGGEVVTVRYSEWQLKPGEARPGGSAGEGPQVGDDRPSRGPGGKGGDGKRRGPSPEMREKMMQLSEEQRGKMFQKMMELREKNPDMSSEDRTKIMSEMVEKMGQKK
tara:strand:+ start:212 stop:865 length:654 start_codon:yes stop_codon:yes gene_type:complete